MKDEVVLLAVTKMLSGFCIGGISLSTGQWVRPVKEHGTILLGDIKCADGAFLRPFDVVRFELFAHRPKPPHVEDWTCDFVKSRPSIVRRLEGEERLEFCAKYAVEGSENDVLGCKSSLTLCAPRPTAAQFSLDEYSGKYEARIYPRGIEKGRGLPVTDLKWRALGRELLSRSPSPVKLPSSKLKETVGAETVYVALGLSRLREGRCWPLAVGVHTFPDHEAAIDYSQP